MRVVGAGSLLLATLVGSLLAGISLFLFVFDRGEPMNVPDPHLIHDVPGSENISAAGLWSIDLRSMWRHRREAASDIPRRESTLHSLDRHCGATCSLRLRRDYSDFTELRVHLTRFRQIPKPQNRSLSVLKNGDVLPLVQVLDSESRVHARISRVRPDCLYSARFEDMDVSTVLSLCHSSGRIFGTIALPSGTYTVEPAKDTVNGTVKRRHSHGRFYLLYKVETINFATAIHSSEYTAQENVYSLNSSFVTDSSLSLHSVDFDRRIEQSESNEQDSYANWFEIRDRVPRSRRSANSWDHYVEVLVVADMKMLHYHQDNLENYILTLFSTVSSIYRHSSLKAALNVIVVRIMILKQDQVGPMINDNAQDTLQNFCRWQRSFNDKNDDSINHYDVAILLTRHDICRAAGKCDTLGLAELGTVCDELHSCAVIEDNGLSSSFTIAHELGHLFNIPHDDEKKCGHYMALNKNNYHIMAPTLEYNTHPWSWSACSSAMLTKFLDQNRARTQCLLDQPIERKFYDQMFESPVPGVKFDVNQQCQLVFGPTAELCPYMPPCRRLWCATYYGNQMGCRTQHMPWADGTTCGHNMWCYRGECVGMAPEQLSKQDGNWGAWKQWGRCSRTCGGGIQKAQRDCDNPRPVNGGRYCVGERERYRSCNMNGCPDDAPGFREMQCSEHDDRDVGIHGLSPVARWVPKYSGISENERCKLYCRASGTAAFYLLKEKVLDGTRCDRVTDDICIDGTCQKAGCDHRLGSELRRDECGICGGDNSTCKTISGKYNDRGTFGYNKIMLIPAGAANIDIRQYAYNSHKDDDNYLALLSANGEYMLNGHYQVSVFRQQIPVIGAVLDYSGSDTAVERINSSGPIGVDIYLHVLSVGNLHPPDVRYYYLVSNDASRRTETTQYLWRIMDTWANCSAICQGIQHQAVACFAINADAASSEGKCDISRKPQPRHRACNSNCHFEWRTEPLSACSVSCGRGLMQQRSFCNKVTINDNKNAIVMDEHYCSFPRPSDTTFCNIDCAGRKWHYTNWSECSGTCGSNSVSERQSFCIGQDDRRLAPEMCQALPVEPLRKDCNQLPCPIWHYGQWSECSRSCDGGIRMRHAVCIDPGSQRELPDAHCGSTNRKTQEKCNEHDCANWQFGQWSGCSVSCGSGMATREAICVDGFGQHLPESGCDHRERIVKKPCHLNACQRWATGEWSSCSVTCLDGWITRSVWCRDGNGERIGDASCLKTAGQRPPSHKPCSAGACSFWKTSEWTQCSATCGTGIRARQVVCTYGDKMVDGSLCNEMQKPNNEEPCSLMDCYFWMAESWTACSVTCGEGVRHRMIKCMKNNITETENAAYCEKDKIPAALKKCERPACDQPENVTERPTSSIAGRWVSGPWTECPESCGTGGRQRRLVACLDEAQVLPDAACGQEGSRPENERACNVKPCSTWSVGPWQPCSRTCGEDHLARRSVLCTSADDNNNSSQTCDPSIRPLSTRNCHLPKCPKEVLPSGKWITENWSSCSTSCGPGWRTRNVHCNRAQCDPASQPVEMMDCDEGSCTVGNATWRISAWSYCSVTCGDQGVQKRSVWCSDDRGVLRPQIECSTSIRPARERRCSLATPCSNMQPSEYVWTTTQWSSCSVTCGDGRRTRGVYCTTNNNVTVDDSLCPQTTRPNTTTVCRSTSCLRWHVGRWSTCSLSCGSGFRTRRVFCRGGGRLRLPDWKCIQNSNSNKPRETETCQLRPCPTYHWMPTRWSMCTEPCRLSQQFRQVYCVNNQGKQAAPQMCQTKPPIKNRTCSTDACPHHWIAGPWTMCSKTCGNGQQYRKLHCFLKSSSRRMHSDNKESINNALPDALELDARSCLALPRPSVSRGCNINPCNASHYWAADPWTAVSTFEHSSYGFQCSVTCGEGIRRRRIRCIDHDGKKADAKLCPSVKPLRREHCMLRNCLPNDCAEIKAHKPEESLEDGDYRVLVAGIQTTVYCHLMNHTLPKTYLNVDINGNLAEIYGKRLLYPFTCPHNGLRNDSCECTDVGGTDSGLTHYSKVRVDLQNMKINVFDTTFSTVVRGETIQYGVAGDCYSAVECPQGRFQIDLRGTGFHVSNLTTWKNQGHRATSIITREQNGAVITGICGGYCGKCSPEKTIGLSIERD